MNYWVFNRITHNLKIFYFFYPLILIKKKSSLLNYTYYLSELYLDKISLQSKENYQFEDKILNILRIIINVS